MILNLAKTLLAILLLAVGAVAILPIIPGVFAYKAAQKASAKNSPKNDVERIARSVELMRAGRSFEGAPESFAVFAIGCLIQYGVLGAAILLFSR